MYGILIVIHLILAVALIALILLQQGKGAQTGAAFGSGASNTVFGSQGSSGFLSRTTWMLAAGFFIVNLALGYLVGQSFRQAPLAPLNQVLPAEQSTQPAQSSGTQLPSD